MPIIFFHYLIWMIKYGNNNNNTLKLNCCRQRETTQRVCVCLQCANELCSIEKAKQKQTKKKTIGKGARAFNRV